MMMSDAPESAGCSEIPDGISMSILIGDPGAVSGLFSLFDDAESPKCTELRIDGCS